MLRDLFSFCMALYEVYLRTIQWMLLSLFFNQVFVNIHIVIYFFFLIFFFSSHLIHPFPFSLCHSFLHSSFSFLQCHLCFTIQNNDVVVFCISIPKHVYFKHYFWCDYNSTMLLLYIFALTLPICSSNVFTSLLTTVFIHNITTCNNKNLVLAHDYPHTIAYIYYMALHYIMYIYFYIERVSTYLRCLYRSFQISMFSNNVFLSNGMHNENELNTIHVLYCVHKRQFESNKTF